MLADLSSLYVLSEINSFPHISPEKPDLLLWMLFLAKALQTTPANHSKGPESIPPIPSESWLLGFGASLVIMGVRAAPVPLMMWGEAS